MKVLIKHISLALFVIGLAASCIKEPVKVSSVTVSPASVEITEGETVSLNATVSPSDAEYNGITWSSSNSSVAMVGSDGTVLAVSPGTATVTAGADGVTGSAIITVVAKIINVTGVSLDKTELELTEGDSATLAATVLPEDVHYESESSYYGRRVMELNCFDYWSRDFNEVIELTPTGNYTLNFGTSNALMVRCVRD